MITMAVAAEDEGTLSLDDCSVLHEKDSGENERQGRSRNSSAGWVSDKSENAQRAHVVG